MSCKVTFYSENSPKKVTNEEKEKKFSAVLESINSVGGNGRSMEEMKNKWKDLKCWTVAKARKHQKEQRQTGGGDAVQGLTAVQGKVLSNVPDIILNGLEGNDTGPIETSENERNSATVSSLVQDEEDIVSTSLRKKKKTNAQECQCSAELLNVQRQLLAEYTRSNELNVQRNEFLDKISTSLSIIASKHYADNFVFEM